MASSSKFALASFLVNTLICHLFLSSFFDVSHAYPVDCTKFIFAPTCRGVVAKRFFGQQEESFDPLLERMARKQALNDWISYGQLARGLTEGREEIPRWKKREVETGTAKSISIASQS